jgi:hypothetical protein
MRAHLLVAMALLAGGCGPRQELPRITIPQLEQARESVSGGIGQRYEDHAACRRTSTDARSMAACMERAGYGYIKRLAEPQAMECWRLLDENQTEPLPEALCFARHNPEPRRDSAPR